jgi:hypothetical protein
MARNQMIKVVWSPQNCFMSKKTNVNDINNCKVPLAERLCTYDGKAYQVETRNLINIAI